LTLSLALAMANRLVALALFARLGIAVHPTSGAVTATRQLETPGYLFDTTRRALLFLFNRLVKVVLDAQAPLADTTARRRRVGGRRCSPYPSPYRSPSLVFMCDVIRVEGPVRRGRPRPRDGLPP